MSRLTTIAKVLALGVFDFFVLGIAGENVGLLYSRIVPNSPAWGWSLYAIGLLLALGTVLVARRLSESARPVALVVRVTLFSFPVFFCGQLIISSVPDWSPLPLALGTLVCVAAGIGAVMMTGTSTAPDAVAAR
ncbi:MAG: hypothetical protein Q7V53_03380 [Caldisericota bacterium]|nr:hypothetical protein [Caldisericota bacterium]